MERPGFPIQCSSTFFFVVRELRSTMSKRANVLRVTRSTPASSKTTMFERPKRTAQERVVGQFTSPIHEKDAVIRTDVARVNRQLQVWSWPRHNMTALAFFHRSPTAIPERTLPLRLCVGANVVATKAFFQLWLGKRKPEAYTRRTSWPWMSRSGQSRLDVNKCPLSCR